LPSLASKLHLPIKSFVSFAVFILVAKHVHFIAKAFSCAFCNKQKQLTAILRLRTQLLVLNSDLAFFI